MASPRFNAHPFNLSDDGSGEPRTPEQLLATRTAREAKIFELLRADDDAAIRAKAVDRIERALGAYSAFVENVDGAPTASEYSEAYSALMTKASELFWLLDGLGPYIAGPLDAELGDNAIIHEQNSLSNLARVSAKLAARYKADSGGRPEQRAEPYTVVALRTIFRECYRGEAKPRSKRAFERRAAWETEELEFIKLAMGFIGVNPRGLSRKMRDDARYRPPQENEGRRAKEVPRKASRTNPPAYSTLAEALRALGQMAKTPRRSR